MIRTLTFKIFAGLAWLAWLVPVYSQQSPDGIITEESRATSVLGEWPPTGNTGSLTKNRPLQDGLKADPNTGSASITISDNGQSPEAAPAMRIGDLTGSESTPPPFRSNLANVTSSPTNSTSDTITPAVNFPELLPVDSIDTSRTRPAREPAARPAAQTPPPAPMIEPVPAPTPTPPPAPAPTPSPAPQPVQTMQQLPPLPEPQDDLSAAPTVTRRTTSAPRPTRKRVRSMFTLGPGDSVSFASFDRSDLNRTVRIAPDGTVSYLQAIAVNANGLTIDQLRDKMELELQKYRRDFKLIVTPDGIESKSYSVLGRVTQPGTFVLTRPTTVLEGIASARGVEVGTIRGTTHGLADFERSFVSRNGRKLPIDFSQLYYQGNLSQNMYLQPNDYIYIASVLTNEFYILGAVNTPGRIKMPNKLTLAKAISEAGGMRADGNAKNILIIRGDINKPDVHMMNLRDILSGASLDMNINNRDIIYVPRRPFQTVERALDRAITTYVQSVTNEAINQIYDGQ